MLKPVRCEIASDSNRLCDSNGCPDLFRWQLFDRVSLNHAHMCVVGRLCLEGLYDRKLVGGPALIVSVPVSVI